MESKLFNGLDEEEKNSFLSLFVKKSIESSVTLKKEGESMHKAFFLLEGEVSVRKHSSDEEMEVATVRGGDDILFSLDTLIRTGESITTVVTAEKSTILEIEQKQFLAFCRDYPVAGTKLLQNIAILLVTFLRKSDDKITEMYKTLEEVL